jgi:hypothetical protein
MTINEFYLFLETVRFNTMQLKVDKFSTQLDMLEFLNIVKTQFCVKHGGKIQFLLFF